MRFPLALFLVPVPFIVVSCATPVGPHEMTTTEYLENVEQKRVGGHQVKFDFRVHASRKDVRGSSSGDQEFIPSITVRYGHSGKLEVVKEVIYPIAYEPAAASEKPDFFAVTPVNPSEFETRLTGWTIEVKAERKGPFVQARGVVRYVAQTGMTSVPGGVGPLMTEDRIVVSENLIQFPRFAEYSTPFTLLLLPGKTYSFEVSHPNPGTMIDVTATALPRSSVPLEET